MGLPVEINPLLISSSGYVVDRSLRFRSSASAYLNRTPASTTNQQKWTWSGWIKRGSLGANQTFFACSYGTSNRYAFFRFNSTDNLAIYSGVYSLSATTDLYNYTTTAVYRDPSAWYHVVFALDTTQATASNRAKLYVNGIQVTAFSAQTDPALNGNGFINSNIIHTISGEFSTLYFDGYLAEVNFIDGQQLTPSSFGAYDTNGVWQPLKYGGTYGTNGFYLPFSDTTSTTTLCYDKSGNGNNWTPNNISLTAGTTYDSMIDSPTVSALSSNYPVINPLDNAGGVTISDGNLKALWASASDRSVLSTIAIPSSGKFYAELTNGTLTTANIAVAFGLGTATSSRTGMVAANMWVYYASNQSYISRNGTLSSQIGSNQTIAASGILQVAIDRDNNQAWLGYNNVWVNATNGTTGDPSAGTNPTVSSLPADLFILCGFYANSGNVNFGQRPFSYTPPSGFNALNTYNLPTPTIANGAQYMAATTYSGTGATQNVSNAVNGVSFQPDFAWIKVRSTAAYHALVDSLRVGTGGLNILSSNATDAEWTSNLSSYVTGFNSNGIALGDQASTAYYVNRSGDTYVGWQWNAGSGSSSSNTSGSITSTVSVNTTAGFSIVTYTGTQTNSTVGHGLGVAPSFIIQKLRSGLSNWHCYHVSLGASYNIALNTTAAADSSVVYWNSTAPTSSVFSLGTSDETNKSGGTCVAYCFAAVSGYSAFGSYTGNGSSDGPFVYTGFRPRWIMIKRTDTTNNWFILDSSRDTYNVMGNYILANTSDAEAGAGTLLDFTSNGFKLRVISVGVNASAGSYIYAAFAENPFNYSRAR